MAQENDYQCTKYFEEQEKKILALLLADEELNKAVGAKMRRLLLSIKKVGFQDVVDHSVVNTYGFDFEQIQWLIKALFTLLQFGSIEACKDMSSKVTNSITSEDVIDYPYYSGMLAAAIGSTLWLLILLPGVGFLIFLTAPVALVVAAMIGAYFSPYNYKRAVLNDVESLKESMQEFVATNLAESPKIEDQVSVNNGQQPSFFKDNLNQSNGLFAKKEKNVRGSGGGNNDRKDSSHIYPNNW